MRVGLSCLVAVCASCAPASAPLRPPPHAGPSLTIATFNILDDRATDPATLDAIGAVAAEADVLALQEITPESVPLIQERLSSRFPYSVMHPKNAAGIGFLSAYPMTERAFLPEPHGWHPALHVTVETPAGTLSILNVHLHAPEGRWFKLLRSVVRTPAEHRAEIEQFYAACTPEPDVVLGDFNEETSGAAVEWLEDRGFQNLLPRYRPGQITFRAASMGEIFSHTLDHVLVGPTFVPRAAHVSGHGVSDHWPVIARFARLE